jgi:hypothetical protein
MGVAVGATPMFGKRPQQEKHDENEQDHQCPEVAEDNAKTSSKAAKTAAAKKDANPKKLSAIDAAAKVLGETGQPMRCPELIEAMAKKRYWQSPGGKTPAATLYAAILKEITAKGKESRFMKVDRGQFGVAKRR